MTKEVKAVHTPGAAMVANAHLTAAAPDLLAALRECSELLGSIPASKSNPRAADAIRKARAAIAKAKGEV